jgi:hypothetical protein
MKRLEQSGQTVLAEYEETKKENIFLKYLLNNSYGKCAQNPRKHREYCYTDHGRMPDGEWFGFLDRENYTNEDEYKNANHEFRLPVETCQQFDVWARPSPGRRYNNVGTAASITGASRAVLLEAIQNADDPIYCDTDSLIARNLGNVEIDHKKLGAWKIEETFDEVIITGKKTYCCSVAGKADCEESRLKVRSKGVDLRVRPLDRWGLTKADGDPDEWRLANAATWKRYLDILDGQIVSVMNAAPTFNKLGAQSYLTRRIKATAPQKQRGFYGQSRRGHAVGKSNLSQAG